MTYDFDNYKSDSLTRPRDLAWTNWFKFENVGDKVQGFIEDVFFRPAEGKYQSARGLTLRQKDGTLVNVSIKRHDFILAKTDDLRLGDPVSIELVELKPNKGLSPTKVLGFYGKNLLENITNKTVKELDMNDQSDGGTLTPNPVGEVEEEGDPTGEPDTEPTPGQ